MAQHSPLYTDTDPQTMGVWLELQRSMPAGQKLKVTLDASQFVLQMYEMGVRNRHPDANDEEVRARVAAAHLPRELVIRAYGWDPDGDIWRR